MLGQDAYKRYFSKFTQATNQSVIHHLFKWFFENIHLNYFTLEIDSTVITRYGQQEGAKKGIITTKEAEIQIILLSPLLMIFAW